MIKKCFLAVLMTALFSLHAETINFECLTDNGNGCASMVTQLTVVVTDPGSNQVLFTFHNLGPVLATIAQIYWDDYNTDLLNIASITNAIGLVEFDSPATPGNLPSGNTAVPPLTTSFSVGALPPPAQLGVDPGENLPVLFNLSAGTTFDDVLASLAAKDMRIGMHMISIGTNEGSDSVLNLPGVGPEPHPIPEPAPFVLIGAGLLAVGAFKRHVAK